MTNKAKQFDRMTEQACREWIDEAAPDITDVIGCHVTLTKAGRNFRGHCPFHDDKSGAFTVSPERSIFHCFGCGAGGNMLTFLDMIRKLPPKAEPITDAMRRAGFNVLCLFDSQWGDAEDTAVAVYEAMERARKA